MRERWLEVSRLGRVAYANGLELQKTLEAEVIATRERDHLLLLEHPHTYTIGRRAKERRNRGKSIAAAEDKVLEKWMPEELMAVAKRNTSS